MPGEVTITYKTLEKVKILLETLPKIFDKESKETVSAFDAWDSVFCLYEDLGLDVKQLVQRSQNGPCGTGLTWTAFLTRRKGITVVAQSSPPPINEFDKKLLELEKRGTMIVNRPEEDK